MPSDGRTDGGKHLALPRDGAEPERGISRRTVLKAGAGLTVLGAAAAAVGSNRVWELLGLSPAAAEFGTLTAIATRADDMLSLRFDFLGLTLTAGRETTPARLVRSDPDAYMVVTFEPQSITEEAFWEGEKEDVGGDQDLPTPPIRTRLAGTPSRLAFRLPPEMTELDFTLDSLLAWERWTPSLVPVALAPGEFPRAPQDPRAPFDHETALEVPWGLIISPNRHAGWAHATDAVDQGSDRVELWHTRLGTLIPGAESRIDEEDPDERAIRAVWTPTGWSEGSIPDINYKGAFHPNAYQSLNDFDRWQIVKASAHFTDIDHPPTAVPVNRLMLTALGAWFDARVDFPALPEYAIRHWTNRMTMGRDHYVRVIYDGWCLPVPVRGTLIEVAERKLQKADSGSWAGKIGAYQRKYALIILRQISRSFAAADLPWSNIRFRTIVTPKLDAYDSAAAAVPKTGGGVYGKRAFWISSGGENVMFDVVGTDRDGNPKEYSTPLIFVTQPDPAGYLAKINDVIAYYNKNDATVQARRTRPMRGQKVAMAPSSPEKPGDGELEVSTFQYKAVSTPALPNFTVRLRDAVVRLDAVEQTKGSGVGTPTIEYHPDYVAANGFDPVDNPASIFAKVKGGGVPLTFGSADDADRSGAVATPNMSIGALSRSHGPYGGNVGSVPTTFDPSSYFSNANLLGGLSLTDILPTSIPLPSATSLAALADGESSVPVLQRRLVYPGGDTSQPPEALEVTLLWTPEVQAGPAGLDIFVPVPDPGRMTLKGRFLTPIDPPGDPTYEISGHLDTFVLSLLTGKSPTRFIAMTFDHLDFLAKSGQKPLVDVDIERTEFDGPLRFIEQLKDLMKSGGSGFDIDVSPTGIRAGYTLAIPDATFGLLNITDMSLSAGVMIPFTGEAARVRFAFSTREKPATLTYTIFGGGFFFGIDVGTDGVELFEASIEAGAKASLDLGVASGEVHAMLGVYFKLEHVNGDEQAELTGYCRLGGSLEVLGILSMSLEFYLGLKYDIDADEAWGQASMTVSVEVAFFEVEVSMSVEKRFAGGSGGGGALSLGAAGAGVLGVGEGAALAALAADPEQIPVDALMTQDDWDRYAAAFVPAAF